jgi:hypothetical protein
MADKTPLESVRDTVADLLSPAKKPAPNIGINAKMVKQPADAEKPYPTSRKDLVIGSRG